MTTWTTQASQTDSDADHPEVLSHQIDEYLWSNCCDEGSDSEFYFQDSKDQDLFNHVGSIPKLQPRKIVIKACWNDEICMSEILKHKGGLLISIGLVRNAKVYLSIEETLYLAELGTLMLVDDKDDTISLKDIYEKLSEGQGGSTWEYFEVYKYLKSLGYIVRRHDIPWSLKTVGSCSDTTALGKTIASTVLDGIVDLFKDFKVGKMQPFFDVYLPDSKFRKTSPGDPVFTVFLARCHPPSISEIEELERLCNGVPLKIVHVEHGRVSFFSFERVELPSLP